MHGFFTSFLKLISSFYCKTFQHFNNPKFQIMIYFAISIPIFISLDQLFVNCKIILFLEKFSLGIAWWNFPESGEGIEIANVFLFLEVKSGPFVPFTCSREQSRKVEKVRWHYKSAGIDFRKPTALNKSFSYSFSIVPWFWESSSK